MQIFFSSTRNFEIASVTQISDIVVWYKVYNTLTSKSLFQQNLFTASNFSLAFPYIAAPEEERMENLLLSGLKEACPNNVGVSNIVFSDSCFVEDGTIQKLSDLQSFKVILIALKFLFSLIPCLPSVITPLTSLSNTH